MNCKFCGADLDGMFCDAFADRESGDDGCAALACSACGCCQAGETSPETVARAKEDREIREFWSVS